MTSELHDFLPYLAVIGALIWVAVLSRRVRRLSSGAETDLPLRDGTEPGLMTWEWDLISDRLKYPAELPELVGLTVEELGRRPSDVMRHIHADDLEQLNRVATDFREGRRGEVELELRLVGTGDRLAWLSIRGIVTQWVRGTPVRAVGTFADITQRVTAEEDRDRLFNLSIDLLAVGSFEGYLNQVNPAWVRVLGWARDDLMREPLLDFIHPEDRDETAAALQSLVAGNSVYGLENRFRCLDGTYRWLSWSSFPYRDRREIFSVVRDISRVKKDEQRLLQYQERLRAMGTQLAVVEDRQRRQLAEAIHDGLAQQLFGIRAQATLLKYPEKLEDPAAVVDEIIEILDATMQDARSLSFELFPPVLYEVGLSAALKWLAHSFGERTDLACRFEGEDHKCGLAEDTRAMIYQSVRELLANVVRHAEASQVIVTIQRDEADVTVIVEDDGRGFELKGDDAVPHTDEGSTGFGLFSIRERLSAVNGTMSVVTRPEHGCRVELTVPRQAAHD